jgi:hypothetical protein
MDQRLVLSILMHIHCMYVAYICLYSYVCLYLCIFATYLCTSVCAYGFLCLLMPLMYAYVYLSICLWVMISAKEFSIGLQSMEEREVFSGGSVYIRGLVLPLFYLSSSCNVLHSLLNTSFSSPSLVQPRLSCPLPSLCFETPSLAVTRPSPPVLLSPIAGSLAPPRLAAIT